MGAAQLGGERHGGGGEVGDEHRLQAVVLDPLVDAQQLDRELRLVRIVDHRPDHAAAALLDLAAEGLRQRAAVRIVGIEDAEACAGRWPMRVLGQRRAPAARRSSPAG